MNKTARNVNVERHFSDRIGWLRASVLGANDGIVSTASLIVGVAASSADRSTLLVASFAGMVAGAMSMAAGEYVSVSSQSDTERADLAREKKELEDDYLFEKEELAQIYVQRGLDKELAERVAEKLMDHNALEAHARDELGLSEITRAKPIQAAAASAASFVMGAALPVIIVIFAPMNHMIEIVSASSLLFLSFLGALAAKTGGSGVARGILRVSFWGAAAMAATALVGYIFGVATS